MARNASRSARLHRYRREDMSSAFIIDAPQLQKYPDRSLTAVLAYVCAQV